MLRILLLSLLSLSFVPTSIAQDEQAALSIDESNFRCLSEMSRVRGFFVDNLMDDLDGTLAVANSDVGGVYPPGSVVQLVPTEVMVKHPKGFNAATRDWEFFELSVDESGSNIDKRGFVDVVNKFGGNCFECHVQAKPEWDMICEQDHGCDPIQLTRPAISAIQKTDPRCSDNPELEVEEKEALAALLKALAGPVSAE